MKIFRKSTFQELKQGIISGKITEETNPEKYIKTVIACCDRFVPHSYSRHKIKKMKSGTNEVMYGELEEMLPKDRWFTIKGIMNQFKLGDEEHIRPWLNHKKIRDILQIMNCEFKVDCKFVVIEIKPKEGSKAKPKTRRIQKFRYVSEFATNCKYRVNDKCTFDFRSNGRKYTKKDIMLKNDE